MRGLAAHARALGHRQFLVHAHDHVADDDVEHAQPAIELGRQRAGPVDDLEDVDALAVPGDLVGQPAPAPVLGAFDGAAEPIDDGRDLRVQFGQRLFGGFRWRDVDQFVLTDAAHMPPYGHQAALLRRGSEQDASFGRLGLHSSSSARLNTFITSPSRRRPTSRRHRPPGQPRLQSRPARRARTWPARGRPGRAASSPRPTPIRSRAYRSSRARSATDRKPLWPPSRAARPAPATAPGADSHRRRPPARRRPSTL